MKEQKNATKILYIMIAIIIIIGAIVCGVKGFKIELGYTSRQQMMLSNHTELDSAKIEEIAKSVLENKQVKVQQVERFGNAVEIIATEISDDEKENIVNKINEQCNANISNDSVQVVSIPNTRIRDILKPYILPGIVTFVVVLLYFILMYHKIGFKKVLLKGITIPIMTELLYYAIIAITRIPFGRVVNSIAIGLYVISIGALAIRFQKEKEEQAKNDKKENDE